MVPRNGVPFVDLVGPHLQLEEQLIEAVRTVVRSATFIGGPALEDFERSFAEFCGVEHCVGVSSGTDALRFALMAGGVQKGDIVITVSNTFVATIEAIIQAGATPNFVDIDPRTFNMSVNGLKEYLDLQCYKADTGALIHRATGQIVRAVLPVHLYGQMCDMDAISELAEEFGLTVFEDACQAHGSEYFSQKQGCWQKAGSVGKAAAFSFYPGKNLGACGEAGAITTNDEGLARRARMIRDHGQNKKYHHSVEGYNGRLDTIQAAILRVKLPLLNEWNQLRRSAAETYNQSFKDVDDIITPFENVWSRSNYHLYVVRTSKRNELQKHFTDNNVGTGLHYPVPVHLQEGYRHLGYSEGALPVTEARSREILSLPMFPQLKKEQQDHVAGVLLKFFNLQNVR
jgi:dTDP-4-amino-4,6-dideoxygalactose transaminase